MSKLKMLKFEAATLQQNSKKLIEQLQKCGVAQLEQINNNEVFISSTSDEVARYEKSIDVVSRAMGVLSEYGFKPAGGFLSGRRSLTDAEFSSKSESRSSLVEKAYEICSLRKTLSDAKAETVRLEASLASLSVWQSLDVPFGRTVTESSVIFVGTLPRQYTYESLNELFANELCDVKDYEIEIVSSSKEITAICVVCHKSCEKEIVSFLRSIGFILQQEDNNLGVREKIEAVKSAMETAQKTVKDADDKLKDYGSFLDELSFAYDCLTVKRDEYAALSDVAFTDKAMYICGYVPERQSKKLDKVIKDNAGAIVFTEPSEDDDIPVLLSNSSFSEPVEGIVEMYATPGKDDIDPSPVMAFFYYLLFGMMLSDAGYGLIMTIGTALILWKTNVEGSMRKTMKMFFYSGISTVIWGALFGSWFGDVIPVVCKNFLGIPNPPSVALWFEPINDPITLLLFSFVIGICHLFLGLIVFGYMKWKAGDKVSAIFDTIPIMLTVLGAAPLAGGILTDVPKVIKDIAVYLLIAGVVLIVLTSSRTSKNIFARLGGGLYGLYNIASGYLSDILSYSRLLALGLATGSIASVVNMLAVMPENKIMKAVVFIVVFIVGHSLNMAINVLGAYVHTNRLQFVELFSKFYEGGGRAFQPFKFNTKYFKLKEENENE